MKQRFSFVVARRVAVAHLGLFSLLAVVPDLIMPELEFHHSVRDTLEAGLLSPALLVHLLWPRLFDGAFYVLALLLGLLFSSVAWGSAAGVLWSLLHPATSPLVGNPHSDSPD